MPIALGIASRPTYDAAEALLRNKSIEYEREMRLKQLAQQKKLAAQQQAMQALGMLNQNMQQQAAQANQRAMQQEQIQAQMQRDAMQRDAMLQQQQLRNQSLLERQFNQMEANWQAKVAEAEKNNMGFDPAHQPRMNQIKESMLKIDQEMAAGNRDAANGFRQKMALLQQMATFKPDMRIKTLQEQMQERIIRVGPNGQVLGPNDPPMQGERLGTVNDKGVFDPFTPLPAPKPDPAVAAEQKRQALRLSEESRLVREFDRSVKKIMDDAGFDEKTGNPVISREQAESRVRQEMKATARQFERTFGVPHPEFVEPTPKPLTSEQSQDLRSARELIQKYGNMPIGSNGPQHDQMMEWAKKTVETLNPIEEATQGVAPQAGPQAQAAPPPNINGQAIEGFAAFALSPVGQSIDETSFAKSPIAKEYMATSGGNQQEAYRQFDADRAGVESQVPRINTASEASQLAPGSLFFNDRGELLRNIPNPQKAPPRRPQARGGAGGSPPRPKGPGQGGSQQKPPPPGRPQQPQPPQKKGLPIDRVLGSGDGKDRRGNVPPKTMLILKKGDPANQKLFDDVISKLNPEAAKSLVLVEVDPSQPESAENRTDLIRSQDVRAFPTLIRSEWDGKKYVTADRMIAPRSAESLGEFMKNGKKPPPPGGNMAHTYVILDAADKTGAAEKWAKISGQMTAGERGNVTVFKVDSRLPDSPTNDMGRLVSLGIDPKSDLPAVVRGEWVHGRGYVLKAEARGKEALEPLRDVTSYRDFARPYRDQLAEDEVDHDIRDIEKFTKQMNENADKTGDPLNGVLGDAIRGVTQPYGQPQDKNRQDLRTQANLNIAYDQWRNAAESAELGARGVVPRRAPSPLPGPTPAEIEAAKARMPIGPPTMALPNSAGTRAAGIPVAPAIPKSAVIAGELGSARATIRVYGDKPSSALTPAEKMQLDNAYRTVSKYSSQVSPETGLTSQDEDTLKATRGTLDRAQKTIDRLNQKRVNGGYDRGYKLNEVERSEYDQAKSQIQYSNDRIAELMKKAQSNQAKSQQLQQQDRDRQQQQQLTTPPTIAPPASQRPSAPPPRPPMPARSGMMSSLPPIQPSRTAQLKQGLATSVMRPGQLNIDEINAGLAGMTGPRPQPYTGGILGGMQKPPTEPSYQLGMGVNPLSIFGPGGSVGNPYTPPGGFIQQPGYMGGGFDYGGGSSGVYNWSPMSSFDYYGGQPQQPYQSPDIWEMSTNYEGYGGFGGGGSSSEPQSGYEIGGAAWDFAPTQVYDPYSPTITLGPSYE